MRQQINLYQPIFSEERKPLSALSASLGLVILIGGLIAFSVHTHLRVKKIAAQAEVLREQQTQQEALLAEATEKLNQRSNPAVVEARVKRLTASLDARTRALQLLKSGAAGQTSGFAARLEGLARRHVEGLWIDSLTISGSNGSMSIAGATLNADIVPAYLQNLAKEQVLAGLRFDEFIIERPAPVAVTTDAEEPPGKPTKAVGGFIRFRAGNKALASTPTGDT